MLMGKRTCMPKEKNNLSFESITAELGMMGKKLDQAQKHASRVEELLDGVACDLTGLVGRVVVTPFDSTHATSPIGRVRKGPDSLPRQFNPGVAPVLLIRNADGSAEAQIEGRACIPLSPLLATLLEILKADTGYSDDHLVGWKSTASIQLALKGSTGQNHSEASVKELIYNLRNSLARHREARSLVENKPRFGYRFAVRRAAGTTTEQDNH